MQSFGRLPTTCTCISTECLSSLLYVPGIPGIVHWKVEGVVVCFLAEKALKSLCPCRGWMQSFGRLPTTCTCISIECLSSLLYVPGIPGIVHWKVEGFVICFPAEKALKSLCPRDRELRY
jgi:hypothetical protein